MPSDEHDDYDRPRRRPRSGEPEDDDYDDRPRRRPRSDEPDDGDYDDRPRRRRRPSSDPMDDPAMGLLLPVNTSGLAIAAGYMGLISVLCIPAPIALLLGILALVQLSKKPKLRGKGRAIFAIIMGGLCTLAPVVFLILSGTGIIK